MKHTFLVHDLVVHIHTTTATQQRSNSQKTAIFYSYMKDHYSMKVIVEKNDISI